MRRVRAVLGVGEEGHHDFGAVAQEARLPQRQLHRLQALRLARPVGADLHASGQVAREVGRRIVGAPQNWRRNARAAVELAGRGKRAEAGEGAVAGEAGCLPLAVALCGGVRVAGRSAGAEPFRNGGRRHRHLIVDRRHQCVELGGEVLQGRGEPVLLARHRQAVVDHEENVRFRCNPNLRVLGNDDQCHGLHRYRHIALAAGEKDEQRDLGDGAHAKEGPPAGPQGLDGAPCRQACRSLHASPATEGCCQFACCGYIANLSLDR